jgi:hypothetical protein
MFRSWISQLLVDALIPKRMKRIARTKKVQRNLFALLAIRKRAKDKKGGFPASDAFLSPLKSFQDL